MDSLRSFLLNNGFEWLMRTQEAQSEQLLLQFFQWDSMGDAQKSWWSHFEEHVPRLSLMGVTHVWLPPPNKGSNKLGRGYDAYDLWDLGEFDQKGTIATRWGTRSELESACRAADAKGISILIDAVLNHKIGADGTEKCPAVPVDSENRLREIGPEREVEVWVRYNYEGRNQKYSSLKWDNTHFTGIDYDQLTKSNQILKLTSEGHKGWSKNVDDELGNYDYLMGGDIDHRHPEVSKDLQDWGKWILEVIKATGFRLDAIKHIDRQWLMAQLETAQASSGAELFVVGEYWSDSLQRVEGCLRLLKRQSKTVVIRLFDVPLHYNFHHASILGTRFDLRKILQGSLMLSSSRHAVTFVDNHDTQPDQTLESWVQDWFKPLAYALILLRPEGVPCLFYGDLFPGQDLYSPKVAKAVEILTELRKSHASGTVQEFTSRDPTILGFTRSGVSSSTGCVVLLSIAPEGGEARLRMRVGRFHRSQRISFTPAYGQGGMVAPDKDGWAAFTAKTFGATVWIPQEREDTQ